MFKLVIAAALLLIASEGTVVRRQDDNSTIAVPPSPTPPPKSNTTSDGSVMVNSDTTVIIDMSTDNSMSNDDATSMAPVTDIITTMLTPEANTTNADASSDVSETIKPSEMTSPTPLPCQLASDRIAAVFSFTQTPEFKELSQNEQIVVYELLAAGENCKMKDFITAKTAERIFRLLTDLPLKLVYTFVSFVSESLANEGVVVPE